MDKADRGACEVWIQAAVPGEAGGLASMIAPLIDQDADVLEAALLQGPVQAGRDLSAGEASQLAEILEGFGARAEVRMGFGGGPALPAVVPPAGAHLRSTQPFDAGALRATLEARGIDLGGVLRGKPEVPRDMAQTPPVPALAPEPEILMPLAGPVPELAMQAPIIDKALLPPLPRPPQRSAARSKPPAPRVGPRTTPPVTPAAPPDVAPPPPLVSAPPPPPPVSAPVPAPPSASAPPPRRSTPPPPMPQQLPTVSPLRTFVDAPPIPGPLMTDEPTQVNPMDEAMLRAAIAAAEAAEAEQAPVPPPLAQTPAPPPRTVPPAPSPAPPATGPARPVTTTGEQAALRGKVGLPRSLQSSRDDLPPWFPRMPMRPVAAPRRSPVPLILFGVGVVVALGTLAFFLLR